MNPDPERGWSPMRAKGLGRSLVKALMEGEFWREFGEDDVFVLPRLPRVVDESISIVELL